MLLAQVKHEVAARLEQSLHNAILINLGKELQPHQVKRPWDAEIKIGLKPPEPLPENTSIVEVFDRSAIAGKLLILGTPGSGKTTTMLELAQELVTRAEDDPSYPIPVLFNLSFWEGDRQSLSEWLIAELKSKYGFQVDLGKEWVEKRQLLPMLDGLDEVEPVYQQPCVQKINEFLQSEHRSQYLILCSRYEEYEKVVRGQWQQNSQDNTEESSQRLEIRLHLNGVILLQPLTDGQIQAYLTSLTQIELSKTLQLDDAAELLKLVRTPLFLSVLGFIAFYKTLSFQEWRRLTSTEARLQYLLDAYWEAAITRNLITPQMELQKFKSRTYRRKNPPNIRKIRKWLVYLAQQLQKESQTEFLIEKMQPEWLTHGSINWNFRMKLWIYRIIYRLIIGLTIGSIIGLIIGTASGIFIEVKERYFQIFFSLMILTIGLGGTLGLIIGGIIGFIYVLDFSDIGLQINPVETLDFSLSKSSSFRSWTIAGGITALMLGLISLLTPELKMPIIYYFMIFFSYQIFWHIAGLIFGTGLSMIGPKIERKIYPNQGVFSSILNTLILSVIWSFLLGGILSILLWKELITRPIFGLFTVFIISLGLGLLFSVAMSGIPVIQHFSLRMILWCSGYIPWNYARFLDYCTERMLLQRVGGRYRFIHKLLQDHFAQMEFERLD